MALPVYHVSRFCRCTPPEIEAELNRIVAIGGTIVTLVPHQAIVEINGATAGPYPSGYWALDIIYTTK